VLLLKLHSVVLCSFCVNAPGELHRNEERARTYLRPQGRDGIIISNRYKILGNCQNG